MADGDERLVLSDLHCSPEEVLALESFYLQQQRHADDETVSCFEFIISSSFGDATSTSTSADDSSSSLSPSRYDDGQPPTSVSTDPPQAAPGPEITVLATDSAGDLVLPRRPRPKTSRSRRRPHIRIRHTAQPTPVADVGLQVWRGACLLCDWLMMAARGSNPRLPHPLAAPGTLVLELGGGVGLAAVAAAAVCRDVIITDVHVGALRLAASNLAENAALVRELRRRRRHWQADGSGGGCDADGATGSGGAESDGDGDEVRVEVCQLDWYDFLAYGSDSVSVEAIIRALREGDVRDGATLCPPVGLQPPGVITAMDEGGATVRPCSVADGEEQLGSSSGRSEVASGGRDELRCSVMAATSGVRHNDAAAAALAAAPAAAEGRLPPAFSPAAAVTHRDGAAAVLESVAAAESLCLVAADTVYDPVLTEAFVKCAAALMSYHASVRQARRDEPPADYRHSRIEENGGFSARAYDGAGCHINSSSDSGGSGGSGSGGDLRTSSARLIVSLEKRINFVFRDMAASAPAFDDFMSYVVLEQASACATAPESGSSGALPPPPRPPAEGTATGDLRAGGSSYVSYGGGAGASDSSYDADAGRVTGDEATETGVRKRCRRAGAEGGQAMKEGGQSPSVLHAAATVAASAAAVAEAAEREERRPLFRGRRLDVASVPQVLRYERCEQLELWELTLLCGRRAGGKPTRGGGNDVAPIPTLFRRPG